MCISPTRFKDNNTCLAGEIPLAHGSRACCCLGKSARSDWIEVISSTWRVAGIQQDNGGPGRGNIKLNLFYHNKWPAHDIPISKSRETMNRTWNEMLCVLLHTRKPKNSRLAMAMGAHGQLNWAWQKWIQLTHKTQADDKPPEEKAQSTTFTDRTGTKSLAVSGWMCLQRRNKQANDNVENDQHDQQNVNFEHTRCDFSQNFMNGCIHIKAMN